MKLGISSTKVSSCDELKLMNLHEKFINDLIKKFEEKYPDYTVEIDSYNEWYPVLRSTR